MDLARCYQHLLPGAIFATVGSDHALTEWLDPRPMPSLAEVEAAWAAIHAADAAAAQAATVAATNKVTLESRAADALASNKTYIGRASPTAAQNTAQIKALSQQNNAIIRLLLDNLDATD